MKKYEKIFEKNVDDVVVHDLANLTPQMNYEDFKALKQSIKELGQLEPAIFWKGKLIDGRHRLKAIKELGGGSIKYKNLDPKISQEEVENMIVLGFERRRHQTTTQKAIGAYFYILENEKQGIKVTMGEAADKFGSKREYISKVKKIHEIAGMKVLEELYNGKKIIVDEVTKKATDNLNVIYPFFKSTIASKITNAKTKLDLTDDEKEFLKSVLENIYENHGKDAIEYLCMLCSDYK